MNEPNTLGKGPKVSQVQVRPSLYSSEKEYSQDFFKN